MNYVRDINTNEVIRAASREEWEESVEAIGGTGAITVHDHDGTVYVDGDEWDNEEEI